MRTVRREPQHPALRRHAEERQASAQDRLADGVTDFAGSMPFIYIHIVWFALWILLGVEPFPFGLLTMIVSLEAIFLSAFVLISQNRADEKRHVIADHQWELVQLLEKQNEELLATSRQLLTLAREIRRARP
jgi:uncharacterized membrane protein